MGDIEDRFLKQNVPGRWSSFEVADDIRNEEVIQHIEVDEDSLPQTEEDILVEKARDMAKLDLPEPIRRRILADRMSKSKTGVKGVLEDYRAFQKLQAAHRVAEAENRNEILHRIATGSRQQYDHTANTIQLNQEELSDDDDEFFESYRQRRLEELRAQSMLPQFGTCMDVDNASFMEAIDNEDRRITILVHLYEPSVLICARVNRFLEEIARAYPNVKFLRMQASSNQIEVDLVTLPILTFYKAGDSVLTLAGLGEELGGDFFKKEDLEWVIDNSLQQIP